MCAGLLMMRPGQRVRAIAQMETQHVLWLVRG